MDRPVRELKAFDAAEHTQRIRRDGYTIIEGILDAQGIERFRAGLAPHLDRWTGRNSFEGLKTERVYTLVARGEVFEEIAADWRILTVVGAFLRPGFLLSAAHAIRINPREAAQSLHYDDAFYPFPRPRPPLGMSVIGAVDAFTAENGATVVIPGSHAWDANQVAAAREAVERGGEAGLVPLEMPAGAAAVFAGTLVHGAGANRSAAPRLGYTNQYCEPWARTQENWFLAIPRETVRTMAPALQALLGYSIMAPFMGEVTGYHPLKALDPTWEPPVVRQERG
ncbi:MAG TPA: phytanoyl-CoA dioxygenase family protein [Caulobacteraceae bacterium]|jgi:ectoine hydroxylase-related dioxygenase (phytanoyl-CoA dioxygenase family)|nr:phytanoyl-CoA dioxygenase family protein [Caulobacteraceae bacterium]